jgi:hypothetical protein
MLEASGDLDLPKKSFRAEGSGELMAQQLDRNEPIVLEIVCQVDRCHPAGAQLSLDAVAVNEGCLNRR